MTKKAEHKLNRFSKAALIEFIESHHLFGASLEEIERIDRAIKQDQLLGRMDAINREMKSLNKEIQESNPSSRKNFLRFLQLGDEFDQVNEKLAKLQGV
jgi:hypothetical protein